VLNLGDVAAVALIRHGVAPVVTVGDLREVVVERGDLALEAVEEDQVSSSSWWARSSLRGPASYLHAA
jgi:hypothetical protein